MALVIGVLGFFLGKTLNLISTNIEEKIKLLQLRGPKTLAPKRRKASSNFFHQFGLVKESQTERIYQRLARHSIEIFMIIYSVLVYTFFQISLTMILLVCLGCAIVIICKVDLKTFKIPNHVLLFLATSGLLWCFLRCIDVLLAVSFLIGIGLILKYSFEKILKKPSLGMGDIKLMGVSGLWIQFVDIPLYFIIAGVVGAMMGKFWLIKKNSKIFPFAPALCTALLVTVWWRVL